MSIFNCTVLSELTAISFWGGIVVGLVLALVAQILVRLYVPLHGTGAKKAESSDTRLQALPATGDIAPEILAVIATAVHVVLAGRPHKIHSIVPQVGMASVTLNQQAWSMEGRRQIFQSHRIR